MFSLFKPKSRPAQPLPFEFFDGFVFKLFKKIHEIKDSNEKLEKYIDLYVRICDLERDFGTKCLELELELDAIDDAFRLSTDPTTLFACALTYGVSVKSFTNVYTGNLPDHLKARLLRTYIISELDQVLVDPKEFDPALQHAFNEVEQRQLDGFEKRRVLEQEFGITGWRCEQEMNSGIIYD
jgi:hypothetical protein